MATHVSPEHQKKYPQAVEEGRLPNPALEKLVPIMYY